MSLDLLEIKIFFLELVKSAQVQLKSQLPENIETYIVLTLSDVEKGLKVPAEPLFDILLMAHESNAPESFHSYKRLGDVSLFTLGLFPEHVSRRNLSKSYFRAMGQMGYSRAGNVAERSFGTEFGCLYHDMADFFDESEKVIRRVKGLAPFKCERL